MAAASSIQQPPSALPHTSIPFTRDEAAKHLPYDVDRAVFLEVTQNEQPLYSSMLRYLSKQVKDLSSFRADMTQQGDDVDDVLLVGMGKGKGRGLVRLSDTGDYGGLVGGSMRKRKTEVPLPEALPSLGWHSFDFTFDETTVTLWLVIQRLGWPTGDGAAFFYNMVVFAEGPSREPLLKLCKAAIESQTKTKENRVALWRFDITVLYRKKIKLPESI